MTRIDIINHLIARYFPEECHYFEVGVSDPNHCFNHIRASHKAGVDPGLEHGPGAVKYPFTSDEFFHRLGAGDLDLDSVHKWNIIFIDGLHLAPQVFRDLINSLDHISQPGFVVLHDVNPPTSNHAHSDHGRYMRERVEWNGTVWKVMYHYRTQPCYGAYTVDTDWGVGIIDTSRVNEPIDNFNPWMEYGVMAERREASLGLITPQQFREMHS